MSQITTNFSIRIESENINSYVAEVNYKQRTMLIYFDFLVFNSNFIPLLYQPSSVFDRFYYYILLKVEVIHIFQIDGN